MQNKNNQPIKYVGNKKVNMDYHHGQLQPVVGVQNYQVIRANRSHPELCDDFGWTYNHAPMMAYWNNKFYLEYLSNPVCEHTPPGHSLLTTSDDGINWEKPRIIFPEYRVPDGIYQPEGDYTLDEGSYAVMHQRMGFYEAADGRLLILGFYGICPRPDLVPFDNRGIGRVVREIYPDQTVGPIYFIRYNRHAGWNESNTAYSFYLESSDKGFIEACQELLENRLMTQQWLEEAGSQDDLAVIKGDKQAFCFYHLDDGRVVGLWKWSRAALSEDEGNSWTPVVEVPSLVTNGAKVWGQRTGDGKYMIVHNPSTNNKHRWPLALVTSLDGLKFDNLLTVNGEVAPRRYLGGPYKDYGLNYVRGIQEGNGQSDLEDMWVSYSMNKEDIWVSRIPVPVQYRVKGAVDDDFNDQKPGGFIKNWNIYSPIWAPVTISNYPDGKNKSMKLMDKDPYDYAKAERVFQEGKKVEIEFKLLANQETHGCLYVEVTDDRGCRVFSLILDEKANIRLRHGRRTETIQNYQAHKWYQFQIKINTEKNRFEVFINNHNTAEGILYQGITGDEKKVSWYLANPVFSVERILFQTGPVRDKPTVYTEVPAGSDLPNADEPVKTAIYYLNYLRVQSI